MNKKITCNIVQDLLPNYIEKLNSDDSNAVIEEHLSDCVECTEVYEQMITDLGTAEKIPVIELKFLKKIKRTRLLAAALCIVITLGLSYLLYASEYKYTNDKSNLSAAITEYTSPFRHAVDAYVLETKEVDGLLIVTFKDQTRTNVNGVAFLNKGINQRYRIIRANIKTSEHSAVVQIFRERIKDEPVYIVSGYNLSDEIKQYGLSYATYKNPGYASADRVWQAVQFDVENSQFFEIYPSEEMDAQVKRESNETLYNYHLISSALYNADGIEITDDFSIKVSEIDKVSCGIGTAEREMLYVFIAIVVLIGSIMTRYFLTD